MFRKFRLSYTDFSFLTLVRTLTATDVFLTLEIKMTNTEVTAAVLSNTYIDHRCIYASG